MYAKELILTPRANGSIQVAIGAASTQSAALTADIVDINATSDCWIAIGTNPTATTTTSYPIAAGLPYRLKITSGDKIAVIQASAAGTLTISPMV